MTIAPEPAAIEISVDAAPVLSAWDNGRIEWSSDALNGGPPLRKAQIDPARVAQAVGQLVASAAREPHWFGEAYSGPGSRTVIVIVRQAGRTAIDLRSWHPLFEADPRVVATATGVEPLNGRERSAVLAAQPPVYQSFRQHWDRAMALARSLLPSG